MNRLVTLMLVAILWYACSKTDNANHSSVGTTPDSTAFKPDPPAITPIGTPIGNAVSATIGAAGGSLTSADGRIVVTIPANALTTNTNIGIQAVVNTAPGGIGVGYHLMPDGTKFATPASLTFHYADSDVLGAQPYLLYIAFQDSTNAWEADFANRNIDTVAKTATEEISHFSLWSLGNRLSLSSIPVQVKENETSSAQIVYVKVPPKLVSDGTGAFELSTLPITKPVPDEDISNWSVDGTPGGDAQDGTIVGPGSSATFTAPSKIDKNRTVQISAEVTLQVDVYNNKQLVNSPAKFLLLTDVDLISNNKAYSVELILTLHNTSGLINDTYIDGVTMQVEITEDSVIVSGFVNRAPVVTPTQGTVGTMTAEYLQDTYGLTNVTSGYGALSSDPTHPNAPLVSLYLTHSGTVNPSWVISDNSTGIAYSLGGDATAGLPPNIYFNMLDQYQSIDYAHDGSLIINVTPIQ